MHEAVGDEFVRHEIGSAQGVRFSIAVWSPAEATVDLSFACMFEREAPGTTMKGGLLHLDQVLGGALNRLRSTGAFRAQEMETLLVTRPPAPVGARSLMVIGLGDPVTFAPGVMERAARVAVREALRLPARTVAFAPDLLDAGLGAEATANLAPIMVRGVLDAFAAETELFRLGFSAKPETEAWTFDAGSHPDATAEQFRGALRALGGTSV